MKPIVLIGPMGAGKTTLGKKLAKALGLPFTDTDREVEKHHGPIAKIFEEQGEDRFRDLEATALSRALESGGVIATGGGVILREANREAMKNALVVLLDTSYESVIGRVNIAKRPLLRDDPGRWSTIYEERIPIYRSLANLTIFTGNRPIKDLLEELQSKVESHEL